VVGNTTSYGPGPTSSFILKTDSVLLTPNAAIVAVEDYEEIEFLVYPNPVTNQTLYLTTGFPIEEVRMHNMEGRIIQTIQGEKHLKQSLFLNNYANGMYILEVITPNGSGRKKILINQQ
jgi:hypothetical protein